MASVPRLPDPRDEPVLRAGWVAGIVLAAATFLLAWAGGLDWRVAAGNALLALVAPVAGAKVARERAWAPSTVDDIIAAESVIAAHEAGALTAESVLADPPPDPES